MSTSWPFGDLRMFGYGMIMVDPPWRFKNWSERGDTKKSANSKYSTMSLDEIKALPVGNLAGGDAVIWLWATHPMLPQAIEVLKAWGAFYSTSGVWVKRTVHGKLAFGTGHVLRCASEPFLIGTFGSPFTPKNIRTVIEGPLREHSRKPDEAYDVAAHMTPPGGFRADLFSRERRDGWEAFGDQVDLFSNTEAA